MKNQIRQYLNQTIGRIAALVLTVAPVQGLAIEFDEVKNFDDVFRISAQAVSADLIEVSWDIEPDYYLYNNKFLRVSSETDGVVLDAPLIPEGKMVFDPLLGEEVIKFHSN
jgi:thiol:disulfide interchange protein